MNEQSIIFAIDAKIAKLQQARSLLVRGGEVDGVTSRKTAKVNAEPTRRVVSPEARARIAEAQRKRWAATKVNAATPTKATKKAAKKVTPKKAAKRTMSPEARKRIGEAQRKRWAAKKTPKSAVPKKAAKKAAKSASPVRAKKAVLKKATKRTMSPEARQRIADAQRKRWAAKKTPKSGAPPKVTKKAVKKAPPKDDGSTITTLGLTLSNITPDLKEKFSLADDTKGVVVVDVVKDSPAAEKGLKAGDLIVEAAQEEIKSATQVAGKIDDAKRAGRKSILLLVERQGDLRFIALRLDQS